MPLTENQIEGIGIAAGFIDALTDTNFAGTAKEGMAALNDLAGGVKYPANPHLLLNGHCDEGDQKKSSPRTVRYFTQRKLKKFGGGLLATAGNAAGVVTQVNVGGILRHGVAEAKTLAHLYAFKQMAAQVRQSEYLTRMISAVITMKITKSLVQGGKLGSSCIPNPIAQAMVGAGVTVAGGIKKKRMDSVVKDCAIEMHWRAFQENAVAGAVGGGSGPAMRMMRELFKFSLSSNASVMGDAGRYVAEPAGWMVIQDKLNLV